MIHELVVNNGRPVAAAPGSMLAHPSAGPILNGLLQYGGAEDSRQAVENFRAAAPLPDEAQRLFDKAVVDVRMERLNLVRRLMELGLVYNVPNWLGVQQLYWERVGRAGAAQEAMNPALRGEDSLPDRDGRTYPVPCQFDDFETGIRLETTAQRAGIPFDASRIKGATRNVHERIEYRSLNGGIVVQGNSSPGFLNAPNIGTYTIPLAWDDASKTGPLIRTDVKAMKANLRGKNFFGPYEMLVSTVYEDVLNDDYFTAASGNSMTIRQRLEQDKDQGQSMGITPVDYLPDDTVILFEASEDVARVVVGQEPVPLTFQVKPFTTSTIILASMFVQVRDTQDDDSGICKGTV